MNHPARRHILLPLLLLCASASLQASLPETIRLNPPSKKRGLPVMQALALRASVREWSGKELSLRDLSDLLWAANGLNRPAEKKYTAPSAINAHDIMVYAFLKDGVYLYDTLNHLLQPAAAGDHRPLIMSAPSSGSPAPVMLLLVSDTSRFNRGSAEQKFEWGALDAGIVSQNISLFCAGTGLTTRPRASMDKQKIRELLKLNAAQIPFLNHPVGYPPR